MRDPLSLTTLLSHYRPHFQTLVQVEWGEVYLAEDTELDRKVALKILSPEVASQRDRMDAKQKLRPHSIIRTSHTFAPTTSSSSSSLQTRASSAE